MSNFKLTGSRTGRSPTQNCIVWLLSATSHILRKKILKTMFSRISITGPVHTEDVPIQAGFMTYPTYLGHSGLPQVSCTMGILAQGCALIGCYWYPSHTSTWNETRAAEIIIFRKTCKLWNSAESPLAPFSAVIAQLQQIICPEEPVVWFFHLACWSPTHPIDIPR